LTRFDNALAYERGRCCLCRMLFRCVFVLFSALFSYGLTAGETLTLRIADNVLHLEVARSAEQHHRGLMGRTSLPANTGMVFLFEQPQTVAMWMKDTALNLDIIYVNACGEVFHTDTMSANSLTLHPSLGPAVAAIELAQGALERLRIRNGFRIPELTRAEHCRKP